MVLTYLQNTALKLKLKAVQQHIVELGSKQKKVFRYNNIKTVNSEAKPVTGKMHFIYSIVIR